MSNPFRPTGPKPRAVAVKLAIEYHSIKPYGGWYAYVKDMATGRVLHTTLTHGSREATQAAARAWISKRATIVR